MKQLKFYFSKTSLSSNDLAAKLQGFLMSQLSKEYADFLHEQETNPYSQFVLNESSYQVWVVNLLTEQACEEMQPILLELERIDLESYSEKLIVEKLEVRQLPVSQLIELFNSEEQQETFTIQLLTPTSFKVAGEYVIFPTVRLLFQSLMQKYSRLYPELNRFDEELLDYLVQHSKITSYHLQTHYFSVHRKKLPAFKGKLTIKLHGASTLRSFVRMLLAFGEYSGVGMKTSMGMGGMKIEERKT